MKIDEVATVDVEFKLIVWAVKSDKGELAKGVCEKPTENVQVWMGKVLFTGPLDALGEFAQQVGYKFETRDVSTTLSV